MADDKTRIGPSSWISVTFLGGLLASAIYGTATVVAMASDLQHGIIALTAKADATVTSVDEIRKATVDLSEAVTGLSYRLNATQAEFVPYRVFTSWAWELQRQNPSVSVPKVDRDGDAAITEPKGR